jgi:hypothetical protein
VRHGHGMLCVNPLLELLRTASGGSCQVDGINAKGTKVILVKYGENQRKPLMVFSVYDRQRIYDTVISALPFLVS